MTFRADKAPRLFGKCDARNSVDQYALPPSLLCEAAYSATQHELDATQGDSCFAAKRRFAE